MRQSKILVISAHNYQLDRRITAEVNSLTAMGKQVTLISVPTSLPITGLDPAVTLITPAPAKEPAQGGEKSYPILKMLWAFPEPLKNFARNNPLLRSLYFRFWSALVRPADDTGQAPAESSGPEAQLANFFRSLAPAGQFDAIHCHDLETLPGAVYLRNERYPGAKIIYDSHEFCPFQRSEAAYQEYWTRVEKDFIHQADLVITVNQSIAQAMAKAYDLDRVEVLYNSCERPKEHGGLSEEDFLAHFAAEPGGVRRVITHGSGMAEKNIANLVMAFGRLGPEIRLYLLALPEVVRKVGKMVHRHGLDNVFVGPWVDQAVLLDYLAKADLGVIPYSGGATINHLLCTPNKLFEYIEARVPICASDLPELNHIIRGRGIGEVYEMSTEDEIHQALTDCLGLLENDRFTAEAMDKAREELSWQRQADKLLEMYQRLRL